eukprot:g5230.t1
MASHLGGAWLDLSIPHSVLISSPTIPTIRSWLLGQNNTAARRFRREFLGETFILVATETEEPIHTDAVLMKLLKKVDATGFLHVTLYQIFEQLEQGSVHCDNGHALHLYKPKHCGLDKENTPGLLAPECGIPGNTKFTGPFLRPDSDEPGNSMPSLVGADDWLCAHCAISRKDGCTPLVYWCGDRKCLPLCPPCARRRYREGNTVQMSNMCGFCKRYGDGLYGEGKLICEKGKNIFGKKSKKNFFVHEFCALVSPKIWVDDKNGIRGFRDTVKAKMFTKRKCHRCKKPGATLNCSHAKAIEFDENGKCIKWGPPLCNRSYHLLCASRDGCGFSGDRGKNLFCPEHWKEGRGLAEEAQRAAELPDWTKCISQGGKSQTSICNICLVDEFSDQVIFCSTCNGAFHFYCVNLRRKIEGPFSCDKCCREAQL